MAGAYGLSQLGGAEALKNSGANAAVSLQQQRTNRAGTLGKMQAVQRAVGKTTRERNKEFRDWARGDERRANRANAAATKNTTGGN